VHIIYGPGSMTHYVIQQRLDELRIGRVVNVDHVIVDDVKNNNREPVNHLTCIYKQVRMRQQLVWIHASNGIHSTELLFETWISR
jgi:hypothetical protein